MGHAYGGQPEAESIVALCRVIELGVTLSNTAELYGPYENEVPLGKALNSASGRLGIATKFGCKIVPEGKFGSDRLIGPNGILENAKTVADESLKRLGIKEIDLDYLHRINPIVAAISRLEENVQATDIQLSSAEMAALDGAMPPDQIVGDRYGQAGMGIQQRKADGSSVLVAMIRNFSGGRIQCSKTTSKPNLDLAGIPRSSPRRLIRDPETSSTCTNTISEDWCSMASSL